ncbi:hypothetical protein PoB_002756200 [Plakobranchus ocellatus]|uniref:Uncharacterized protein n=1 Tax=Plakobranchus ocellatus TaxID=259542 RepID=A0AAV4A188_9GAST|nr:hypothetical protein PoB_002756200 [Plakobranchus ocellatus]
MPQLALTPIINTMLLDPLYLKKNAAFSQIPIELDVADSPDAGRRQKLFSTTLSTTLTPAHSASTRSSTSIGRPV